MENDEDLFSMLDGVQQATRFYGNDDHYFGQAATQLQPSHQEQRDYASKFAQPTGFSTSRHDYGYGHDSQPLHGRSMMPRIPVGQQDPDRALFVSSSPRRSAAPPYDTPTNIRGSLSQSAYEPSSAVPDATSSPAARACQRRHEIATPRITQPSASTYVQQQQQAPWNPSTPQRRAPQVTATNQANSLNLLSTHALPDRFRSVFPYPNFNAMQSKCFSTVYNSNDNFVLSSPTGSGKTAIFELAICRLIYNFPAGQFKVVYQAPTKSLCSERQRDWQSKFRMFQLECAELTGDTDAAQMGHVKKASIIVTTPEKWDSITRKWKDHDKLMSLIKLFLIDEVHMLHEARGATLEAVVSRMKSVHSEVRFIALSATVPNSNDIATWLGRNHDNQEAPAREERFGEEYRPVRLQKHVVGYQHGGNDFSFDKLLDAKLPEVIAQYSHKKPIMVFCITRKTCEATARLLTRWWASKNTNDQYWRKPRRVIAVEDRDLKECTSSGVAWHHAGLSLGDRNAIENGFRERDINVICCTSTLAVGVNLPCHMVIIKNTMSWLSGEGMKEYTDLEVMQMLGRAGRPQYDTSAVAVIMTKQEKAKRYEKMVSGEQILESCLHEHFIDHLNAEIGLGTVTNLESAKKWLTSTFLYIRLQANPNHYKLDDRISESNIDARLENICCRDLDLLRESEMVAGDTRLESTAYGEAMARCCVRFETAKGFLALPKNATISEMLSVLSSAQEWQDMRFRGAEKARYKDLNNSPQIRFRIPVNLDLPAHKVSLIIQSQLGGTVLPADPKSSNSNNYQYQADVFLVFQQLRRLIRCIVDFKSIEGDSISLRNALFMCRSIGARCWDDWPLVLKQLDKIGPAGVLKLVNIGIKSIEAVEHAEPHRLESALKRNQPFGRQIIDAAKAFPKLRVSLSVVGKPNFKAGEGARLNLDAEIGFLNEKPVTRFQNQHVYLIFMAETSDGRSISFARSSAEKVGKGQIVRFSAHLTSPNQVISCYVMCDEIAGTCTSISLKPTIPSITWPTENNQPSTSANSDKSSAHAPNTSKRRESALRDEQRRTTPRDEYGDDMLDDEDLVAVMDSVEDASFRHTDSFEAAKPTRAAPKIVLPRHFNPPVSDAPEEPQELWQPKRLSNGKWDCNHKCKDKQECKHYCCNHGLDNPPKEPGRAKKAKNDGEGFASQAKQKLSRGQTTLNIRKAGKRHDLPSMDDDVELMDLSRPKSKAKAPSAPKADEYKKLAKLHSATQKSTTSAPMPRFTLPSLGPPSGRQGSQRLSFLPDHRQQQEMEHEANDFGLDLSDSELPDDPIQSTARYKDDAAMVAELTGAKRAPSLPQYEKTSTSYGFGDSDGSVEAAMVGLADSQAMRSHRAENADDIEPSVLHTSYTTAKGVPPGIEKSMKSTGAKAPFFASSRDPEVPSKPVCASASKHEGSPFDANALPKLKKPRQDVASISEGAKAAETPNTTEDKSSDPPSEIDPMIMQMFGSYVNFV